MAIDKALYTAHATSTGGRTGTTESSDGVIKLAERDRDADRLRAIADAATRADWEQVRLNGGPPCFHIEDGRFCFRAERWPGHPVYHPFTTLHDAARGEVSK